MKEKEVSPDEIIHGILGASGLFAAVFFGPAFFYLLWAWKNSRFIHRLGVFRPIIYSFLALIPALSIWFLWLDTHPLYELQFLKLPATFGIRWLALARILVIGWWIGSCIAVALSPLVLIFKKDEEAIRTSDFKSKVKNFNGVREVFEDPMTAPIGIDLKTGAVVSLTEQKRCSHVIVLGATGAGKTTLLCNLVLHTIRHGQPCLVIDPKGEDSTLRLIRKIGGQLSDNLDSRFKVFKMSSPAESCQYNPLKHGSAIQLKDRILEALNWSEQYYQSIAGDFLTVLTACTEKIGVGLTLELVSQALGDKLVQKDILGKLREQGKSGDRKAEELFERFSLLLGKVKAEDLLGLQAQLSMLNSPSLGHLLSFETSSNEIDLREVLKNKQIAYFQLDTLGNPDTARRLGRMIIEDIKSLASEVYRITSEEERKFFPIFIDEFGSFASKEFIEVLKQIRGARFGTHLFAQGLEDLDVVSPEFRRQASSNPITKIAFRLDDNETVNEICSMAGTIESLEQSYQVEGKFAPTKTGLGNLRETRQMVVEYDVLKNLNTGQAVVIRKSPSQVSGVQVFLPSVLICD